MRALTVIFYVLVSLIVGITSVSLALGILRTKDITSYLEQYILTDKIYTISLGLFGTLVTLLCIRYLQKLFFTYKKEKTITLESEEGKISITISAIEDMLKKMLDEKEEFANVRPRITSHRGQVQVVVRGYLAVEVNLLDFSREIQDRVKEKIRSLLGDDKQAQVTVEIKRVISADKKNAKVNEPQVPFRNY